MCVNHSHFHLIFSLTLAFYLLLILFPLSFVIGSMIRITNSLIYIIIQSSNQMLCYLNICLTQYNFFFILLFVCKLNKKLSHFFYHLHSFVFIFFNLMFFVFVLSIISFSFFLFVPSCSCWSFQSFQLINYIKWLITYYSWLTLWHRLMKWNQNRNLNDKIWMIKLNQLSDLTLELWNWNFLLEHDNERLSLWIYLIF